MLQVLLLDFVVMTHRRDTLHGQPGDLRSLMNFLVNWVEGLLFGKERNPFVLEEILISCRTITLFLL